MFRIAPRTGVLGEGRVERFFAPNEILVAGLVAMAAAALGAFLGRLSLAPRRREREELAADVARSEGQIRELSRQLARMRGEQKTLANVLRVMPGLVRELNRADLNPQDIPKWLFRLAEEFFEPRQILLFLARSSGKGGTVEDLFLRDHRGLGEIPRSALTIRVGDGKIGWVARTRVDMLTDDWLNLSRTEGRTIEDNHPAFRLDLVGPLVHYGADGEQLLGVLCVGEPASHPKDEKLLLQMITNLGSIAYVNARNVRALKDQANHDGLTGLLNKRHFMVELGKLLFAAGKSGEPLTLFMFDIDHFKIYNDTHGHLAGDEILKEVARLTRETCRQQDLVGRYGGEEFIVAMPLTNEGTAFQVAERIRAAVAAHHFPHAEHQPMGRLTISGGIAGSPKDGTASTDLIEHADRALYRAKASGRNRVLALRSIEFGGDAADDVVLPVDLEIPGPPMERPAR